MSVFRPTATAGPSNAANASPPLSTTVGVASKAFMPPLFGDFGKDAKDLFKKKYEFENQAKFVSRSASGTVIETVVVASNEAPLRGVFKSKVPITNLGRLNGTLETEFHTVENKETKTTYKSPLGHGVTATIGVVSCKCKEQCPGSFAEGYAKGEVEYQADYVAGSLGVRTDGQKTLVDGVAALGYDNISVGGKVTVDTASKAAPQDYNFGAQYNGVDYTASAFTEKQREVLNFSFFQRLSRESRRPHNFGAILSFGLKKPSRSLTVGTDYWVDADTTVRAQAKIESGSSATKIQTVVEHRLLNPSVLLGVSAEFDVTPSNVAPGRVGVSLTFGDF